MNSSPFLIDCQLNSSFYLHALIDTGCLCFAAFSKDLVKNNNLPRIKIPEKSLQLAEKDEKERTINEVTYVDLDIDGRKERVYGYIIQDLTYQLILGKPWMEQNDVVYHAKRREIRFETKTDSLVVREQRWYNSSDSPGFKTTIHHVATAVKVVSTTFISLIKLAKRKPASRIFAISMEDINKALETKSTDTPDLIYAQLPDQIKHWLQLFIEDQESTLPPHRASDMKTNLEKDDKGREKPIPWGPLYGMSRDELLVLRKTLTDHLDKGWIRASSSPGGAPVLFVKKPGGGLRFCVDYRALNAITEKDRYPLPLIRETLRAVSKSTWITKVDVRAAFHKLSIREGDEEKTAFRTRFGSFEWLVTPFGLQGAPAAFQRYVNESLGDYLDNFSTAL
ncbi:hypothetical protein K3495_g1992 [Podosphaera aphanis]|nr:hypothetical protein K3495_g1992 [Podosphaera aphanis]